MNNLQGVLRPVAVVVLVCLLAPLVAQPAAATNGLRQKLEARIASSQEEVPQPDMLNVELSYVKGYKNGTARANRPLCFMFGFVSGLMSAGIVPMLVAPVVPGMQTRVVPGDANAEAFNSGYYNGSKVQHRKYTVLGGAYGAWVFAIGMGFAVVASFGG